MKKNRSRKRQGVLTLNNIILEKHEMATVAFLLALGWDIELIPPSIIPGRKMPDIWMQGLQWEMKSPKYSTRSTIEHTFQSAAKQAENVIFDLRRVSGNEKIAITILERRFTQSKRIKRMLIINKHGELLRYL